MMMTLFMYNHNFDVLMAQYRENRDFKQAWRSIKTLWLAWIPCWDSDVPRQKLILSGADPVVASGRELDLNSTVNFSVGMDYLMAFLYFRLTTMALPWTGPHTAYQEDRRVEPSSAIFLKGGRRA